MPSVDSVYFHHVPKAATSRSTVRYASGNGEPVQIVDVKAPGAPFLAFAYRQEGKDLVMEVAFDGRKVPAGRFRGVEQATVHFTNPRMNQLPLNIQWELKPAVQATPAELVFQDTAGQELRQKLTLKQADGRPFRVTGSRCSLAGVRVEGLGQKAASQELSVVLPASLKAGRYSEVLSLTTDDPGSARIDDPLGRHLEIATNRQSGFDLSFALPGAGASLEGCRSPAGPTSSPSSPWPPSRPSGVAASPPPSTACRRACPWGRC